MEGIYTKMARIAREIKAGVFNDAALFLSVFEQTEMQTMVADLIREQLGKGLKGDGSSLPDYSATSVKTFNKPSIGDKSNKAIRLYDSGEFYESIVVQNVMASGITIFADGSKEDRDLVIFYGQEIIELSEESLGKLIEVATDKYIEYGKEVLLR